MPGCTDSHTDGPGCCSAMGAHSPFDRTFAFARRTAAAPLFVLFMLPGPLCAADTASDAAANAGAVTLAGTRGAATDRASAAMEGLSGASPSYGSTAGAPGSPSDAAPDATGAGG